MFKIITNQSKDDPKPYKLGYYNRSGKWVLEKEFDNEAKAFEAARALNSAEPTANFLIEFNRPKRSQFY